jgi:hypothetical protein
MLYSEVTDNTIKCRLPIIRVIIIIIIITLNQEQHTKAQRGVEVQFNFFFNLGTRKGWVVRARPRPLHPGTRPI